MEIEFGNERCQWRMNDLGRDQSTCGQVTGMDKVGRATENAETLCTWLNGGRFR